MTRAGEACRGQSVRVRLSDHVRRHWWTVTTRAHYVDRLSCVCARWLLKTFGMLSVSQCYLHGVLKA